MFVCLILSGVHEKHVTVTNKHLVNLIFVCCRTKPIRVVVNGL